MSILRKGVANHAEMPFFEHLEVLRWHIIRSIIAILIITVIAFLSKGFVFSTVIFGPTKGDFATYRFLCWLSNSLSLGNLFCMEGIRFNFINIELAGQFLVHLKTSAVLGFVVAFPYIFWEFWSFIKPGLHEREISYTRGVVFFSSLLFITGICFGYYILTPFALNFFGSYNVTPLVENNFTLTNYIGFLTMFIMTSGVIFELPMVVYFLSKLGLLTPELMRTYRRHAVIVILFVSAIITPADIGTQVLVFIPVFILYEISIFISARVAKNLEAELQ